MRYQLKERKTNLDYSFGRGRWGFSWGLKERDVGGSNGGGGVVVEEVAAWRRRQWLGG
jgi:hypothetical protein